MTSIDPPQPYDPSPQDPLSILHQTIHSRWRVVDYLGSGGMGCVYKALDLSTDQLVALKLLVTEDTAVRNRFLQEAFILHTLSHHNIVSFKGSGYCRIHDVLFIAVELLEGPPFNIYLKQNPPPTLFETLQILHSVLSALQHAHEHGVIHRDLKPSNICTPHDDHGVILFDFGIAKIESLNLVSLTLTGQVCGTPCYVAPEQIRQTPLTPQTDLYAFGIILYQVLTGHVPFYDPNIATLCNQHLYDPPPDLWSHWSVNSNPIPELIHLTLQLLSKHPQSRPQTAHHVQQTLYSILQHPHFPQTAQLGQKGSNISNANTQPNLSSSAPTTRQCTPS